MKRLPPEQHGPVCRGGVDDENIMQLVRDNQAAKPFEMKGEIKRFYPHETGDIHQSLNEVQLPVGISKCLMGFKEEKSALQGDDFLSGTLRPKLLIRSPLWPEFRLVPTTVRRRTDRRSVWL